MSSGCTCCNKLYELVSEEISDLLQYFLFLYDGKIQVQFDAIHSLSMLGAIIQGLATFMLLYGAGKWRMQQKTYKLMMQKHSNFEVCFQVDHLMLV